MEDMQVMVDNDEINEKDELEKKLSMMVEDSGNKCKAAKEQLCEMLDITVSKYRTATGTAEALRVLRFVAGENGGDISTANKLAKEMAQIASSMASKAKSLDPQNMDTLCDGFYDKDFTASNDNSKSEYNLAREMMCIDLCRNVGGTAEDMVEFIARVQEEISATEEALKKLDTEE